MEDSIFQIYLVISLHKGLYESVWTFDVTDMTLVLKAIKKTFIDFTILDFDLNDPF